MSALQPGSRVRAKTYRERASRREFISAQLGRVEMVWKDQVMVRLDGNAKPKQFAMIDVERIDD